MHRVALITGASRGIGAAIAQRLGEDGYSVCLVAQSEDGVQRLAADFRDAGVSALAFGCDVTDEAQVESTVSEIENRFGSVSVLVNNAGTMATGPLWEIEPEIWWGDIDVSVRGSYLCTRRVLSHMLASGQGTIINLSSRIATRADRWCSSYACAKAALTRMTDCLAAETADRGVAVFALNPGVVPTDMTDELKRSPWLGDDMNSMSSDDWTDRSAAANAVTRLVSGEFDDCTGHFFDAFLDVGEQAEAIRSSAPGSECRVLRLIE